MKILFEKFVFDVKKIIFIVKAIRVREISFFFNDFFGYSYDRFRIYKQIMILAKD